MVAQQYLNDYPKFLVTACHCTQSFAKRRVLRMEEKVSKFVEMGFDKNAVRNALQQFRGDEDMALEKLCSG
ncbi:hypothetical protein SUGI_0469410 [Cryptomeria japonica]|nr:hypothetical protein SUGI_0469410 [Cryptomeria japonica]